MYLDKMGGNNYVVRIEKDISSLFNRIRTRNATSIITSFIRLAIYNRNNCYSSWFNVAMFLKNQKIKNLDDCELRNIIRKKLS